VYEGLITRHRGRGSFVAEPRLKHNKSIFRGDRYQISVDFTAAPHGRQGER
jgi:hypothetical protein